MHSEKKLKTLPNSQLSSLLLPQTLQKSPAASRSKQAAKEKAEADKIVLVKQAEADAESKYLQGTGIAKQRKAIVDGLRDSVDSFTTTVGGMAAKDVLELVLVTQ